MKVLDGGKAITVSIDPEDAESRMPLSEWQVPAQDSHGHTARIVVRIPPGMKHEIGVVIQSKRFPWETDSDFVRWAVHRGLQQVAEQMHDPEVTSLQSLLNSWVAAAKHEQEHLKFQGTLEMVSGIITDLINAGAHANARRIVNDMLENAGKLDDVYWRERYTTEIANRFGGVLQAKKHKQEKQAKTKGGNHVATGPSRAHRAAVLGRNK